MSDRLELAVHDFLVEGRDEAKSHVLLEIAKPSPDELPSHGHFFALAELSGATPKTIQLVRAWIEFAIDSYYASTPTDVETHFETILNQLNTQSSLYLRQHANEGINMLVAALCGNDLYMAFHGHPGALLLFRKNETWQTMDLAAQHVEDGVGQLFGNIVSGNLRPDDRILFASPRVTEFFTPDRITKISEGKTMAETAEHMEHVMTELASDYSFAVAWVKLERVIENENIPATVPAGPGRISHEKTISSMSNLIEKTRETASLLAPPVISISKDKVITSILKLAQDGVVKGGKWGIVASRSSVGFVKEHGEKLIEAASKIKLPGSPSVEDAPKSPSPRTTYVQPSRSYMPEWLGNKILIGAVAAFIIVGSGIGLWRYTVYASEILNQTLQATTEKIVSADEALTYQNDVAARDFITDAEKLFMSLSESAREKDAAVVVAAQLTEKKNKIFHIMPVQFEVVLPDAGARELVLGGGSPIFLGPSDAIYTIKNGKSVEIGSVAGTTMLLADEEGKRAVLSAPGKPFSTVSYNGGAVTEVAIEKLPENKEISSAVIYSSRLYAYDKTTQMIYRYDKKDSGYGAGKNWITDQGRPVGITRITADTSLWLLTDQGTILKFTAGKLQPFSFSNAVPQISRVDALTTGSSASVLYFLDRDNKRLISTDRNGALAQQYIFPANENLKSFAIDKTETTATGITDDGKIVKFNLAK